MQDPRTGQLRAPGSTLSLGNLISSLNVDAKCAMHNSGNDAFMCLFALQKLVDPENTLSLPTTRGRSQNAGVAMGAVRAASASPSAPRHVWPAMPTSTTQPVMGYGTAAPMPMQGTTSRSNSGPTAGQYLTPTTEFGQSKPKLVNRLSLLDQRQLSLPAEASRRASTIGMNASMKSLALR